MATLILLQKRNYDSLCYDSGFGVILKNMIVTAFCLVFPSTFLYLTYQQKALWNTNQYFLLR